MNKVAIFARVSTLENQEYERQISDLTRVIKIDGYTEEQIEIFAEKVSGYKNNEDRPELTRLLNLIEKDSKVFNSIYVTEVSRLGRNPKLTRDVIERLCELKIPIKILNPSLCTLNPDGSRNNLVHIMLTVAMEFSDIEAKTMKTRMRSGKLQRAIEGKTGNNIQAFGYTADGDGNIIINPAESIYVEQIFELYKSGKGTLVIARTLNQMNIPTKKGIANWSDVVVRQILINPIYKGEPKIKIKDAIAEVIDGKKVIIAPAEYTTTKKKIEPIISDDVFNECNELLKSKTNRNYLTAYEYLLKDMMFCGVCGKKYFARYIKGKKGDKVYKCTSYLPTNTPCGNRSINISLIESVIFDQISKSDTLLKYLDNPNDILKQIEIELASQEQLLKNEIAELKAKEKQTENLLKAMTASKKPNFELYSRLESEIAADIESINGKIRLLNKDIFSKKTTIANYDTNTATKEMFVKATKNRPELRSIFRQFIDKIIINQLNKDYVLATLFIKVNGIVLPSTLKLFVYANGVRRYGGNNEKVYKYLVTNKFENDPVYKHNILLVDTEEILAEFQNILSYSKDEFNILPINEMITIKRENYIYINEGDV